MLSCLRAFAPCLEAMAKDGRGATAIEYALLAALIAAVIVGMVTALGLSLAGAFDTVNDALEAFL